MQNDASTSISVPDMKKIIEASGHQADIVDFAAIAAAATEEQAQPKAAPKKKEEEKK